MTIADVTPGAGARSPSRSSPITLVSSTRPAQTRSQPLHPDVRRARPIRAPRFVGDDDRTTQLDRLVAARTADVRVHLERVSRAVEHGDALRAYGALVDLFVDTDTRHAVVRGRALHDAAPVLTSEHLAFLQRHRRTGLTPTMPMPPALHSLRSLGITSDLVLVAATPPDAAVIPSPRQAADLLIDEVLDGRRSPADLGRDLLGPTGTPAPARPHVEATPGPAPAPMPTPQPGPGQASAAVTQASVALTPTLVGHIRALLTQERAAATVLQGSFGTVAVGRTDVAFELTGDPAELSLPVDRAVRRSVVAHEAVTAAGGVPAETALWDLGIRCCGGLLPVEVPPTTPLRLTRWPNLTRVTRLTDDLRLAAVLTKTPMTVVDLRDRFPDHPALHRFLAAAWAAGLLTTEPVPTPAPLPAPTATDTGFLRSLVSRLRGRR